MAAVASARPSGPTPKPKRPLPPALQTSPNGVYPTSSPSPSLASKRLPPGSQGPTSAGLGSMNGMMTPNGTGPRAVRRKDSQKFGDGNKPRIGRPPLETTNSSLARPLKRPSEPFVKTTSWMLKKYRKAQPSFTLHLHPQYFRFDQQDGSFSYTSPMRILLEHVKNQTVPQEMLEDLHAAGIKFYECCLIVQIHDHRNTTSSATTSSSSTKPDQNQPFSVHNYNQYVTPSPHVPFPTSKMTEEAENVEETQAKDKQAAEPNGDIPQGPRIFTTVLFPTAMTLQDDLMRIAASRESASRKQGQGQPPSKKQKTQLSNKTLENIEAETILATAPPLYLEPVKDLGEMKQLYDKLADPLCNRLPPAPKSRKRTVAELAADEALAAEQQSFMLIMDERLAPSSTAAANGKTTVADAEANSNATEARFERFKVLEEIKESLREKKERETEARLLQQQQQMAAQQQQAQQAQQAAQQQQQSQAAQQQQQAAQLRHKMEQERAAAQEAQKIQAREMQQAKNKDLARNQQAQGVTPQVTQPLQHPGQPMPMANGAGQHAHPAQSNSMLTNAQQLAASQAAHSSPVVRHMTPQNVPSPAMGNMVARPQGVPMAMTGSAQGAGSPPRPGSAVPHGHPGGAAMMPQRSQQPPSRNGTPAMANGTPRMQQSTPHMQSVTPTPRMNQASPVSHPNSTPMMANGMLGAAHMSSQPQITPQEHQRIIMQQQQQAALQARQHAAMMQAHRERQQMHGGPQQQQQQLQAMAAAQARAQSQQNQQEAYRANMQALQQQMQMAGAHPTMNGMMANQLQQGAAQQQQQEMMRRNMSIMVRKYFGDFLNQLKANYGNEANIPPQELENAKQRALQQATLTFNEQRRRQAMAQQSYQQQAQQQQAAMLAQMQRTGQMNGQMNGMGGMNGM